MNTVFLTRFFCLMAVCIFLAVLGTITAHQPEAFMPTEFSLRAILEINPHDVATIEPAKLVKECNKHLSVTEHLSQSERSRLHLLRGHAFLVTRRFKDAIRDLDEAAKSSSDKDFDCLLLRNIALGNQYAFEHSEELIKQGKADALELIKKKPDSAMAYLNVAMWLMCIDDDINGCIEYCDKSIALDKDDPEGFFIRGLAHRKNMSYQEALDDFDTCIKLGGYAVGTKEAAGPFLERAELLLDPFDNPSLALRGLVMAHQIDPTSFRVNLGIWHWYFKQGKHEMANYLSQKLEQEYPKPLSDFAKIVMLIQKASLVNAFQIAESMISRDTTAPYGYYWRGVVHFAKGDYDAAKRDYDKASVISDNNIHLQGARAYLMASVPTIRNGDEAVKLAALCCERSRYKNAQYIMLLAMSHAAAGQKEEAVKFGKEALGKLNLSSHLRGEYEKRLKLFQNGKLYDFSPDSKVLDYLFF